MLKIPDNNAFIEKFNSSVFYSLISNCIASIHGNLDLVSRGLINSIIANKFNKEQIELLLSTAKMKDDFKSGFVDNPSKTPLFGQLQFINSLNDKKFEIDIDGLSNLIFTRKFNPVDHINQAIRILIITAYQFTKQYNDKSPIWEFFRHIRNASAHGGKFNFTYNSYEKKQEPVRKAKWHSIEIVGQLQGTKLFVEKPGVGLLYAGDIVLLLMDIEDQYPDIKSMSFN